MITKLANEFRLNNLNLRDMKQKLIAVSKSNYLHPELPNPTIQKEALQLLVIEKRQRYGGVHPSKMSRMIYPEEYGKESLQKHEWLSKNQPNTSANLKISAS